MSLLRRPTAGLLALGALVAISSNVSAQPRSPVPALAGVPVFEPDTKWPTLPTGFTWGQVIGIFADSRGHVWTSSRSCISEWDPQGRLVQAWDARGPDRNWSTIHGMFVDHNGYVWTNARESNLTVKFSRTGQVLLVVGKYNQTGGSNDTTLMGRPSEIWVDPADNEVFVADGYGNRRVYVFDGATGKYLRHWGAYGRRPEDPGGRRGGGAADPAAGAAAGGAAAGGAAAGAAAAGARGAAAAPPAAPAPARGGGTQNACAPATPAAGGGAARGAGGGGGRGDTTAGRGGRGGRGGDTTAGRGRGGRGGDTTAAGRGGRAGAAGGGGGGGGGGRAAQPLPAEPPQQFSVPHGIVGSRDGLIYFADRANNRVQVFRQNGQYVAEKILRPRCRADQTRAAWEPNRPCGTEAAFSIGFSHDVPQTYLYVADGGSHFITILRRSDLEVVGEFGGPGVGPGQLGRPHNLTVDPSGNIFVAEAAGPRVRHPVTGDTVEAGFRAQKFTFVGTRPPR